MKKILISVKNSFGGKGFKYGGFSAIIVAIVLAVVIGVNIIVTALPTTLTKIDVSSDGTYTLSESSEEVAKAVDTDVDIFLIAQTGSEDSTIYETLKRYSALNDKIKVSVKDPVVLPSFVSAYTEDSLSENSVIVASGERSRAIDYNELFVVDYTNYYSTGQVSYSNSIEPEITSAIDYVTSGELGKIYLISGHGEASLSSTFSGYIEKENIETEELALLTAEAIPEDADALMMISPTSDISSEEAEKLKSYLADGGKLLLFTDYSSEDRPNLEGVMNAYGLQSVKGIVLDTDANYYYQQYYSLLPIRGSHSISYSVESDGLYNLVTGAHGITETDNSRSTLEISPLLSTSSSAYVKTNVENTTTLEFEEGDIAGSFMVGAAAEEIYGDTDTKVVWFSTSSLLNDDYDSMVGGGNSDLVLNSVSWLVGETGSDITIHSKAITTEQLTVASSTIVIWFGILIIIVPVCLVVAGLVIWLRRRKL